MALLDFVWVDIVPETMPAFPELPTNLATKEEVAATKATLETAIADQATTIGQQIITTVGAEQVVNDAIRASVALNATTLIELQNTNFATLNTKIEGVDSKLTTVDSKVNMVDTRVNDVVANTATQFTQVGANVTAVTDGLASTNTALATTSARVTAVTTENANQDLVLTELVKAATNTHDVLSVFLNSIN